MTKIDSALAGAAMLAMTAAAGTSAAPAGETLAVPERKWPKAFSESGNIPVNQATPVINYSPLTFDIPGRPVPLEVKVSMPAVGKDLPVIVMSHGHGAPNYLSSYRGNAPLVDFFAAHGFIVIQPTHLDATYLGLREEKLPDAPLYWYDRVADVRHVLDKLADIEAAVPGLAGRMDKQRIGAVGHSLGGSTVSQLIGMKISDPDDPREKDLSDPRVKAAVIIGAVGIADEHLTKWVRERYRMSNFVDYSDMTGTALVIAGDKDLNPMFSDRLSYRWDAFTKSPGGNKTLLTFFGADHMYGGITGYDAKEVTEENPELVATLRAMVWSYLRSQLYSGDNAWDVAQKALLGAENPLGKIETK